MKLIRRRTPSPAPSTTWTSKPSTSAEWERRPDFIPASRSADDAVFANSAQTFVSTRVHQRQGSASTAPRRETSPRNSNNSHGEVDPQILTLTLENASLRSQLAMLDDASAAELSSLLALANEKNDALQRRVNEMHAGMIEIEKERRLLKGSVERDREEFGRMEAELVAAQQLLRAEMERVEALQMDKKERDKEAERQGRYLKMRDKEVEVLSVRVGDQERRIELLVEECGVERKQKVDAMQAKERLETQLEKLLREMEDVKGELDQARDKIEQARIREEELSHELEALKDNLDNERKERDREHQESKAEEVRLQNTLKDLETEKQRQVNDLEELLTAFKTKADLERGGFEQALHEKNVEFNNLQAQLELAVTDNQTLREDLRGLRYDMEQMKNSNEQVVSEKNNEIQSWKEMKEALDVDIRNAHESKKQLETQIKVLLESEADLSCKRDQLERENQELAESLDVTKKELEATRERVSEMEHSRESLKQELTEAQQLYSQSKGEIERLNDDIAAKSRAHQEETNQSSRIIACLESKLEATRQHIDQLQQHEIALEQQLNEAKKFYSQSQDNVERLSNHIQDLTDAHQEEVSHATKRIAELEAELKREVDISRELQSKCNSLEMQFKDHADEKHEIIQNLEEELVAERSRHQIVLEALRKDHNAQLAEIETQGASVVYDLEESIASLEKEVKDNKVHHEQAVSQLLQKISQAHTEKELLERQIEESNQKANSQDEQIIQLSNLSQHRGEEMVVLRKELTQLRSIAEKANREHSNAIDAMSQELNNDRLAHEKKTRDMQLVIDDLRTQLAATKARLDANDGELNVAKAKLNERTNLLKEMVKQTKSNKEDYDREHARANQLHDLVERHKSELIEAKANAKRCENEMNKKIKQLWDLVRKETDQRKSMELQLEAKLQNLDDVERRCNDMEKENHTLKDKISRQENYIIKLHEKQERDRRRAAAPLGMSKANRPSTAGSTTVTPTPTSCSFPRGSTALTKQRHYPLQELRSELTAPEACRRDDDETPAVSKRAIAMDPQMPDELDLILG